MVAAADITLFVEPAKLHEYMMNVGVRKAHMKVYKMILMSILSGFYVMVGIHGMITVLSGDDHPSKPLSLLGGLIFAVALMAIVIIGGEFFTGNCLLIVAVLSKRIRWSEMLFDWVVVFFSNLAGNFFFSVLLFGTGFYGWDASDHTAHGNTLCAMVDKKASAPAYQIFFRGIFANFCVCMAMLIAWSAKSIEGKILGMMWPIAIFCLSGFEHSIANQGFFTLATIMNCPTPHGWYWVNLAVATPGNIVGAFIIGVIYYFISLWGTDLSLARHPAYLEDGVTIRIDDDKNAAKDHCKVTFHIDEPQTSNSSTSTQELSSGPHNNSIASDEESKNEPSAVFYDDPTVATEMMTRAV